MRKTLCLLIVLLPAAVLVAEESAPPLLRVPRLAEAPKLDGELSSGEWDGAAALTGLVNFRLDGALAPHAQQATFYLAYDGTFLYLAMDSPNPPGRYPLGRSPRQDGDDVFRDDHVEWQILTHDRSEAQTPGKGFYKVVVNPLGTMLDQRLFAGRNGEQNAWSTGGTTRCSVTAEAWRMEASVAIENLGLESLDGKSLVMHVVRADSSEQNLAFAAWTPGTWLNWDRFGEVVFDPDAPAVQLLSVGKLTEGELDVRIAIGPAAGEADVTADVRVADAAGDELFAVSRAVRPKVDERATLSFKATDLEFDDEGNALSIDVRRGGKVLYRNRIRVDRLSPAQREEFVEGWISRLPQAPPEPVRPAPESPDSTLAKLAKIRRRLRPLQAAMAAAAARRDLDAAADICRRMIRDVPFAPTGYYNLACVEALRGERDKALNLLEQAIDRGFNRPDRMQADDDLAALRDNPRFAELLRKAAQAEGLFAGAKVEPFVVRKQVAWVADGNVAVHPKLGMPVATYRFPSDGADGRAVTGLTGKVGELLKAWYAEGSAAGNRGDLYDNRDGDHSNLSPGLFPQMAWVEYSDHARDAGLHHGLADSILHDAPTIGNASLARTRGPFWRSMPRMAYQSRQSAAVLYLLYRSNKLYAYPCHHDHSPGRRGDVYFANTPYVVISQGSSGSDKPFLKALAATMAALQPETKQALVEHGLLAPTLQMILRSTGKQLDSADDYLTGPAHPTVLAGGNIDIEAMVRLAHDMPHDAVPPVVELEVLEEQTPEPGRDYFAAPGRTEEIFTTPSAVARVMRGVGRERRMIVSAAGTKDPNGRPLAFHWKLLRGDPDRVTIRPVGERGEKAEITVAWHPRMPVRPGAKLESNRVDVGVFADNGRYHSAPAFVTWYCPNNEKREYDDAGRIVRVTYGKGDGKGAYADPVIALAKNWVDAYDYDDTGELIGWTRTRGDRIDHFTADGKLIVRRDDDGEPAETRSVRYVVRPAGNGKAPSLTYEPVTGP